MKSHLFSCVTFFASFFLLVSCSQAGMNDNNLFFDEEWNLYFHENIDQLPGMVFPDHHFDKFSDDKGLPLKGHDWYRVDNEGKKTFTLPGEKGVYAIHATIEAVKKMLNFSFILDSTVPFILAVDGEITESSDMVSESQLETSGTKFFPSEAATYDLVLYLFDFEGKGITIQSIIEVDEDVSLSNGSGNGNGNFLGGSRPTEVGNVPDFTSLTPEPATCLIFGTGLLAAGLGFRRKKHAQ